MKQIIFTFEREDDYNDFTQAIVDRLPVQVGDIEENEEVVHITIKNLTGDTK